MDEQASWSNDGDEAGETPKKQRKSAAGRKLMRWTRKILITGVLYDRGLTKNLASDDQFVLLCVEYVCARDGIALPWDDVAAELNDFVSGEGIKQHLTKVRTLREKEGQPVPPKLDRSGRKKTQSTKISEAKTDGPAKRSSLLWYADSKTNKTKSSNNIKEGKSKSQNATQIDESTLKKVKQEAALEDEQTATEQEYSITANKAQKSTARPKKRERVSALEKEVQELTAGFENPSKKQQIAKLRAREPIDYREMQDDDEESRSANTFGFEQYSQDSVQDGFGMGTTRDNQLGPSFIRGPEERVSASADIKNESAEFSSKIGSTSRLHTLSGYQPQLGYQPQPGYSIHPGDAAQSWPSSLHTYNCRRADALYTIDSSNPSHPTPRAIGMPEQMNEPESAYDTNMDSTWSSAAQQFFQNSGVNFNRQTNSTPGLERYYTTQSRTTTGAEGNPQEKQDFRFETPSNPDLLDNVIGDGHKQQKPYLSLNQMQASPAMSPSPTQLDILATEGDFNLPSLLANPPPLVSPAALHAGFLPQHHNYGLASMPFIKQNRCAAQLVAESPDESGTGLGSQDSQLHRTYNISPGSSNGFETQATTLGRSDSLDSGFGSFQTHTGAFNTPRSIADTSHNTTTYGFPPHNSMRTTGFANEGHANSDLDDGNKPGIDYEDHSMFSDYMLSEFGNDTN